MSDSVNINAVSQENKEEKEDIKVQPITVVPVVDIPPVETGDASSFEEKKGSEIKTTEQKEKVESSDLLECKDCGVEFEFSEREKKFYAKKKLSIPVRCPDCRKEKKDNPEAYKKKMEAVKEEEKRIDRARRKMLREQKRTQALSDMKTPEIVVESESSSLVSSAIEFVNNTPYIPAQVCRVGDDDWKNPVSNSRNPNHYRGVAYHLNDQVEVKRNGNENRVDNNLPNREVPPVYNTEGKIREPVVRDQCTHDIDGCCAICFLKQKADADEQKATAIRHNALAVRMRAENADRAARHALGDFSSSDSSGGSSSSSSESEEEPSPPADVERPIRVVNYKGHYMFDNYENRNKTSDTRVFEVPQACFHGILSAGIHSDTDLVRHYGYYYRTVKISVEMPVSIVNELKAFWVTAKARDKVTYEQSKFQAKHLLRNYDGQSKIYSETMLYAPLIAFWETEADHRGTNAIINEKLWSWNYCFFLLFIYAFMEYFFFNRAFNPFWVSLLFVLFVVHRFGVNMFIETEFMRFSRIKLCLLCLFGALYWFWFMVLTAATYTWQPTESTITYPYNSVNGTVIWSEKTVTYSNIGVYEGNLVFPLSLTCTLLIIYYRMNQLYSVQFLENGIHYRDDHLDWQVPVLGWRQVRSILPPSVFFAFFQMSLIYLYAPYWVGFFLYLVMKWVNRRLSGSNIPHNYRFLLIDVQFY